MTPNPNWRKIPTRTERLEQWLRSRSEASFYDLWGETIDPEWLIFLAEMGDAPKNQLVLAACAVARLSLHLCSEEDIRPQIAAIETCEAWCQGGAATAEQVKEANANADAVYYAARDRHAESHAANVFYCANGATYSATYAAVARSSVPLRPDIIVLSTANAAWWAMKVEIESVSENLTNHDWCQVLCATIRKHIPFERPRPKGMTIWQRLITEDP